MIVKNMTGEIVLIADLGLIINPYGSVSLDTIAAHDKASSNDLPIRIANKTLILQDDGRDLTVSESLRLLYGQNIEPRDWTGKVFYHPTTRPFGTKVHFTGAGDEPIAVSDVGSGVSIEIHHKVGEPTTVVDYVDFNTINNMTHIQEGYLQYGDAKLDKITFEFVPRTVIFELSAGTAYLYDPSQPIILPSELAGGVGNISILSDVTQANGGLVQALPNESGVKPPAFWTADYNSLTGIFENIQSAVDGNGDYNIFHLEYPIARFANKVSMVGCQIAPFPTDDTDPIPHGSRIRCTWETVGEDHEWLASVTLKVHREKSC
jgi:hypothetical protein